VSDCADYGLMLDWCHQSVDHRELHSVELPVNHQAWSVHPCEMQIVIRTEVVVVGSVKCNWEDWEGADDLEGRVRAGMGW
jgi:hypothetical protein